MLNRLHVYYNGWGESWLWGTLISSTATTGRPIISFEYSSEAIRSGIELSSYLLPLNGLPSDKAFLLTTWVYLVQSTMLYRMVGACY